MTSTRLGRGLRVILAVTTSVVTGGCVAPGLILDASGYKLDAPYQIQAQPHARQPSLSISLDVHDARRTFSTGTYRRPTPRAFFVGNQVIPVADFLQSSIEREFSNIGIFKQASGPLKMSAEIYEYGVEFGIGFNVLMSGQFKMRMTLTNHDRILFATTVHSSIQERASFLVVPAAQATMFRKLLEQAVADLFMNAEFRNELTAVSLAQELSPAASLWNKDLNIGDYPHLGASVAILTFDAQGGVSLEEVALLTDRFSIELGRTMTYKILSRSKMKEVLELQRYSAECSSSECAVEAGQMLGVEYMIYGSVGRIGSMYTINVNVTDVEQGSVVTGATVDYSGQIEGLLTDGMARAVNSLVKAVADKKTTRAGQ